MAVDYKGPQRESTKKRVAAAQAGGAEARLRKWANRRACQHDVYLPAHRQVALDVLELLAALDQRGVA